MKAWTVTSLELQKFCHLMNEQQLNEVGEGEMVENPSIRARQNMVSCLAHGEPDKKSL